MKGLPFDPKRASVQDNTKLGPYAKGMIAPSKMLGLAACIGTVLTLAAASPPPNRSATEILDEARGATGGDAWGRVTSIRTEATLAGGGRSGTSERWEDVATGRFLVETRLPPRSDAEGFDGISVWTRGISGIPYLLQDEDAREGAADASYRTARAWWFADRQPGSREWAGERVEDGRTFDLIRITPQAGRPFTLWIDRATHLVDRDVEQEGEELSVSRFTDYRWVDGVRLPFKVLRGEKAADPDETETVQRIVVNAPVADHLFAIPPAHDAAARLDRPVTVPFRLEGGKIIIPVMLNGQGPFDCEFDSGGSFIVPPALARRLGLATVGRSRETGGGEGFVTAGTGTMRTLSIGGAQLDDSAFKTFELDATHPERLLLGQGVLQNFVVKFDFDKAVMTLWDPASFTYTGKGAILPFVFQDNQPEITGSVDDIAGVFTVDTGDSGSLLLLAPYARRYGLVARYHAVIPYGGKAIAATYGVIGRAGRVALNGADGRPVAEVRAPVTRISLQKSGWDAHRYVSANLGIGILKQFNITFDYKRQRIMLEPNGLYGRPDIFDRSGMRLSPATEGWSVNTVYAGGPAEKAGIHAGDIIRTIDGLTPAQLPVTTLRALMQRAPETRIVLSIEAAGQSRSVALVLADVL